MTLRPFRSSPREDRRRRCAAVPVVIATVVGALLAHGVGAGAVHAQETRVAPADSAAVLLEAANTFEAEGRGDVAQALYRLILRRFPSTPAASAAEAALDRVGRQSRSDGSTELQVWGTLYGAWLGVAIPGAFGADDPEPYGLGLLVGAPLGFVAGRTAARRADLTIGQARAITWGGTWGTWQGFGWREVFDVGEANDCLPAVPCEVDDTSEETFAAMIAGGVAGLAVGALLSRGSLTDAQATGANLGALWGSWFGVAMGVLTDLEDDDLLAATLVGGNVGLAGAALATPSLGWSRNRWRIVSAGGLLGGLAGLGIDLLADVDDDKAAVAVPLATSVLGLGIGVGLSRDEAASPTSVGAPGNALLTIDLDSRGTDAVDMGTLLPTVRRLPVERDGRVVWRTTLGITLVQARF